MEALLQLQEQGKIRHVGVSNFTPEMIETCRKYGPIASDQPHYSLLKRDAEADILPYCRENTIGLIVYRPLEQGLLTGKYGPDASFGEGDNRANDRLFSQENRRRIQSALVKIQPIADAHNATLAQVTIAWTIGEPGITAAIVGARNPEQVRDNVGAVDITLSDGERKTIREIFEKLDVPA
jgi:aryl-alcohol dehydrogenase-like predicted oxidoreductase